ncbi:MAG: SDR family oxidoreductase [Deltaproteobacteria bacterium]|nr:MAG: SDR family oxidoreductase [Deltaproteobacteria bacterium]
MELKDVRALVTGGARGMGYAFTKELAESGAKVAFCDLDPAAVKEASEALGVPGFVCNVAEEDEVEKLMADAAEAIGGLNVLINNAGITRDGLLLKQDRETGEVKTMSKAKWDAVIAVNLTGPFLCARAFAKRCVEREVDDAVIVNMSSISRHGNYGQTNYVAAKAGLAADTVTWAKELSRYGIRVGAIAPGFILTPMVEAMPPAALDKIASGIPLKKLGKPVDIWRAVRFIIECDYFTGRVVDVDGGLRL